VLRAALNPRCSLLLDKAGNPLSLRKSWGPSGDRTFRAEWCQSGPGRQGFAGAAANAPLRVPVFIWTLQFYTTYYSNVFYF
jgi:hypothetical protein